MEGFAGRTRSVAVLLYGAALLAVSCGGGAKHQPGGPAEIVNAFFGALRAGDVKGVVAYVHWPAAFDSEAPGSWALIPEEEREMRCREAATSMVANAERVLKDVEVHVKDEQVQGERAQVYVEEQSKDGSVRTEVVECAHVDGAWKVVTARLTSVQDWRR